MGGGEVFRKAIIARIHTVVMCTHSGALQSMQWPTRIQTVLHYSIMCALKLCSSTTVSITIIMVNCGCTGTLIIKALTFGYNFSLGGYGDMKEANAMFNK